MIIFQRIQIRKLDSQILLEHIHKSEVKFCQLQSRSAPEGTWVQQGGLEISCFYEVFVKQALPELKYSLKEKLSVLIRRVHVTEERLKNHLFMI